MVQPYTYGIMVCMKKTLHIDDSLLRDAKSASGARTDTDTVRLGMEAQIRRGNTSICGRCADSERNAHDSPRRRERPLAKRSA